MSSTNGSGRSSGYVSIPVEIIRDSNTTGLGSHSRHNSPFRTGLTENTFAGRSSSPSWSSNSTSRFQPRHSPTPSYDRVITNSQFNQPLNDFSSYQHYPEPQLRQPQQRMYEPGPLHYSRSSEDLLSSPFDGQPQYTSFIPPLSNTGLRVDSDFVQPNRHSSPLRRSFDALNDFGDLRQSIPTARPYPSEQPRQPQQQQEPYYRSTYQTQHRPAFPQSQQQQQPTYVNQSYINPNIVYTDEYGAPTDPYQTHNFQGPRGNVADDRSRSPSAPRGASPARPPSSTSQDEPELKMAKDTDGAIPMPAPVSSSPPSAQSTDQPASSSNTSGTTNTSATAAASSPPPPPEVVRDPNAIALEKLEQIKQSLNVLEKEVDSFVGSTRNDRAYKLLDEQALKIMIRCDELVDVSPDIKDKRKEIIRNVQRVLGKLESKVPSTPAVENNSNPMEVALIANSNEENTQQNSLSSPNLPGENASVTTESIPT